MKRYFINNRLKVITISLLILIIGLASFLRFYQIGKLSFWQDEISTFNFSKGDLTHVIKSIKQDINMSLYYVLAHFWMQLFPTASDGTLRTLSALFSIASIPIVFLLGRTINSDQKKGVAIGLIAAFLVAVNAYQIQYAQEFRSYSLTILLTLLSTYFFIKTIENPGAKFRWSIPYTLVTAASVYCHLFAAIIIAAQAVTLPILFFPKKRQILSGRKLLFCGIGIAYLLLPVLTIAYIKGSHQIGWITQPTFETVKEFFIEVTGNQGESLAIVYLLLGVIGFVFGVKFENQKNFFTRWKFWLMASCFIFPIFSALIISKVIVPIFVKRYLIYILPYLAILAAAGIMSIVFLGKKARYLSASVGIIVLILFTFLSSKGVQNYYNNFQKEDWRGEAQILASKCSDSLRLYYVTSTDVNFLYYQPSLYSQDAKQWNNILKNNLDINDYASGLSKRYEQVCLVLSQPSKRDKIKLQILQTALLKEFPKDDLIKFTPGMRVEIYSQ
jgi:mannosyltransferase